MSLSDGVATEVRFPDGLAAVKTYIESKMEQPEFEDVSPGVEGAGAPLGNTTVLASTLMNRGLQKKSRKKVKRIDHGTIVRHQFELLDYLNDKLPDPGQSLNETTREWKRNPGVRWRVRSCGRIPVMRGNVQVMRSAEGHVHYRGINHCGSVWTCPVCSSRVASFRRKELSTAIATKDCWVALSTFTIRHQKADQLEHLVKILKKAMRSMRSGGAWKSIVDRFGLVGSYTSMEFTWSSENGWHPHMHCLDIFREILSWDDQAVFKDLVMKKWIHALEGATGEKISSHSGEWRHGYTFRGALSDNDQLVQAYYALKWGSSEEQWSDLMKRKATRTSSSHVVAEVTGSMTKQGRVLDGVHYSTWELLDVAAEGSKEGWRLWFEFAAATKNLHQGSWSRGLRVWLGIGAEIPDEEVSDDEVETNVAVDIECNDFTRLAWRGKRGYLLQLAARGATRQQLEDYVQWAVCRRG